MSYGFTVNPILVRNLVSSLYQSKALSIHPYSALSSSTTSVPSTCKYVTKVSSISVMIWLTSLLILMNTSFEGSVLGIDALRYALPMSIVVMSRFSCAAI